MYTYTLHFISEKFFFHFRQLLFRQFCCTSVSFCLYYLHFDWLLWGCLNTKLNAQCIYMLRNWANTHHVYVLYKFKTPWLNHIYVNVLTSNHKNYIFIKFNLCNRDILSGFFTYYYLFKIVGNVKKILSEMKNSLFSKLSEMKCSHTGLDLFYCDIARNNHTYLNLFYYDIARNNHTDLIYIN